MNYCYIFHTQSDCFHSPPHNHFKVQLLNNPCVECHKQITDAMNHNGSFLNVIRTHYYYHEYVFNNETKKLVENKNYPDYPFKLTLCENCNKNSDVQEFILYDEFHPTNDKKINNPINNKLYYVNRDCHKKYKDCFAKLFKSNIDFTLYRYEFVD